MAAERQPGAGEVRGVVASGWERGLVSFLHPGDDSEQSSTWNCLLNTPQNNPLTKFSYPIDFDVLLPPTIASEC